MPNFLATSLLPGSFIALSTVDAVITTSTGPVTISQGLAFRADVTYSGTAAILAASLAKGSVAFYMNLPNGISFKNLWNSMIGTLGVLEYSRILNY